MKCLDKLIVWFPIHLDLTNRFDVSIPVINCKGAQGDVNAGMILLSNVFFWKHWNLSSLNFHLRYVGMLVSRQIRTPGWSTEFGSLPENFSKMRLFLHRYLQLSLFFRNYNLGLFLEIFVLLPLPAKGVSFTFTETY